MSAKEGAATLDVRDLGDGVRRVEVDCSHATTSATVLVPAGATAPPMADVSRVVIQRHYLAEGCVCTARLRQRFGVALELHERGGDQ